MNLSPRNFLVFVNFMSVGLLRRRTRDRRNKELEKEIMPKQTSSGRNSWSITIKLGSYTQQARPIVKNHMQLPRQQTLNTLKLYLAI